MPPAVNLMSTPAIDLETASSLTVTSRDHPPSCIRLWESPKGYLNVWTPPASEGGGRKESGFWPSSAGLPGPGALALLSFFAGYGCCSCPAASATESIPAAANAAEPIPRTPRREYMSFFASSFASSLMSFSSGQKLKETFRYGDVLFRRKDTPTCDVKASPKQYRAGTSARRCSVRRSFVL